MSFSSGLVSVTGSVTAIGTFSETIYPLNVLNSQQTNTGTYTLGTVPANKKWHLMFASLDLNSQGVATVTVLVNGVVALGASSAGTATAYSSNNVFKEFKYSQFTATAGQTIQFVIATSNCNTGCCVHYYEESV